uniref:Putative DNA mismatch repair protein n=1 Tax=Trypanosoma vivax (strain Y486) TaxID=1055687 RepID=G0U814_TRYVY|nr:putative DNA mismatch repair protein, fragment [Trypanosoma vivax Y486]
MCLLLLCCLPTLSDPIHCLFHPISSSPLLSLITTLDKLLLWALGLRSMSDDRDAAVLQAFTAAGGDDDTSCLRLFSRAATGCCVVGRWASVVAREYVKSTAVLKNWGGVDAVTVNDTIAREVIRDCLLRRGVSVEHYERQVSGGPYVCVQRGSPGHIADFEATLFAFEEAEIQLMATGSVVIGHVSSGVFAGQSLRVGFAALNTTLRTVSQASASSVDMEESMRALKQICERSNISLRPCGRGSAFPSQENFVQHSQQQKVPMKNEAMQRDMDLLATLENILRVPEDRFALTQFPLASRALEQLITSMIDPFDLTNRCAYYIKHTVPSTFMKLDAAAIDALHIINHKQEARGSLPTSVYSWLNRCTTGMGARMMRQWLLQPLRNVDDINERLSLVEMMNESPILRDSLVSHVLRRCNDMDRLNRKLQRRTLSLKDVQCILVFVDTIPHAIEVLRTYSRGRNTKLLLDEYVAPLEDINEHFSNLRTLINATINLDDENVARINPEFDSDLGELEKQRQSVVEAIDKEHRRVMREHKWTEKTVKCEYHATYGYVFRVSRKDDQQVRTSDKLITVSTAKDGVRFLSGALSSLNEQYKGICRDYDMRQQDLKQKLIDTVATYLPVLDDAKELIAALGRVRDSPLPMVRPTVRQVRSEEEAQSNSNGGGSPGSSENSVLTIVNARHPLVELRQPNYVPNTLQLTADSNAIVITGPNMGGKSTFMRSIGICVVLAQAGCFVPAEAADIVVRDAIMCRVGAMDHLAQGVSTFMVEMLESAAILNCATQNTLAIIDELGRGTSTYDGFGLAWAIAQEVAVGIKSTLLFSTHFHEMTRLANQHSNVRNAHFGADVDTKSGTLRFSYQLQPGACERSCGLYVAQLAHIPEEVVNAARRKAAELEDFEEDEARRRTRTLLASATPEMMQRVAQYARRVQALESGAESGVEKEALRKRLRAEIRDDAVVAPLLQP